MAEMKNPQIGEEAIAECAHRLWRAERENATIAPLSRDYPDLSRDEAYSIAALNIEKRGSRRCGFKLGYTSAAMRAQMKINEPNFGILTEDHQVQDGTCKVEPAELVHPLIEPEIALLVGRDLRGPGHTRASAFAGVDAAMASLEVVDTRYDRYEFASVDNIADNSSSARYLLGPPRSLAALSDLRLCGVLLQKNGASIDFGIGANALGDPFVALAWLANFLAARDMHVPAGSIVLTGGLTRAHPAERGSHFIAEFAGLGSIHACFQDSNSPGSDEISRSAMKT